MRSGQIKKFGTLFKKILKTISILTLLKPKKQSEKGVILTSKIIAGIAKGFEFGQIFSAHPFQWNELTQRPQISTSKSKWKWGMWRANVFISFAYYGFTLLQFVRCRFVEGTEDPITKLSMVYLVCIFAMLPCNVLAILWKGDQIPAYVSSYMDLAARIEGNHLMKRATNPPDSIKMSEIFIIGVFYGFWLVSAVFGVNYICNLNPSSPELLSSVILGQRFNGDGREHNMNWVETGVTTVALIFQAYVTYNWLATCFVLIFSALPGLMITNTLLTELSSKRQKVTKKSMRKSWKIKTGMYQQLNILVKEGQDIYGFPMAYVKIINVSIFVSSAYGAIRYSGTVLRIFLAASSSIALIYLIVLYMGKAALNGLTCDLLQEWKYAVCLGTKNKLFSLYVAALPPLRLYLFGKAYFVDRKIVLTMFQCMIHSLVEILVI